MKKDKKGKQPRTQPVPETDGVKMPQLITPKHFYKAAKTGRFPDIDNNLGELASAINLKIKAWEHD